MKLKIRNEQTLYKTPLSPAYWKDAAAQLGNVRIICIAAILIVLRIVLKSAYIPVGENLNITFGFFVNALGAMVFGPVIAIIGAAISDTLGAILFPTGTYFFPFIFVEIAGSLIFALWLWRAKLSTTRIILSRFCVSLVCNFIMNPIIMNIYYEWLGNGKSYKFVTLPRVVKNLALFPVEAFLLVLFLGLVAPILTKIHIIPKAQVEYRPEMTKKHIVLLIVLLIISVIAVALFYKVWLPSQA
ncbi:MAG: folate family ECF transporter S component [Clostridia bacterium]|nr:folate family ECF transporter S component [Clostridia bacterium]